MKVSKNKIIAVSKFARDERVMDILEAVGKLGFIMFLGVMAPNAAGRIIKLLGWVPNYKNKYATEKSIKSLEKREFIRFWYKNGKGRIELTSQGKMHLANLKAKRIKLPLNKDWDGLWRVVTFDIPEKFKTNRRRFAKVLSGTGMYNMEKSIFVFPCDCKEQIFKIAEIYEVKKYIRFMVVQSIDPAFGLKTNFPYTKN